MNYYNEDVEFEWDEGKRLKNIEKHHLDFLDARVVFKKRTVELFVDPLKYGEERKVALGKLKDLVVMIVYILRKNRVRIISFRKANSKERKIYDKESHQLEKIKTDEG